MRRAATVNVVPRASPMKRAKPPATIAATSTPTSTSRTSASNTAAPSKKKQSLSSKPQKAVPKTRAESKLLSAAEEKKLLQAMKSMVIAPDDIEDISTPEQRAELARWERELEEGKKKP